MTTDHIDAALSVAFAPDGKTLASGGGDGVVRLWDIRVDSWRQRVCQIANRNLTHAEWSQYMGADEPQMPTCPDEPPAPNAARTPAH